MENTDNQPDALHISKGVSPPGSINPELMSALGQHRRKEHQVDEYIVGIQSGDRVLLAKAITLMESQQAQHRQQAHAILQGCLNKTDQTIRIGITGVPGVGKSSFIEAFGLYLYQKYQKSLAILTIDPTSRKSKGSILADKTRMVELSQMPDVFIRPSPTAESLGGVTQTTREAMLLCEAAGFDVIIIETVGVGQSEIAVRDMVDFFLLLMLPGSGDELQGIKRGIMEMADGLVITKADGGYEKKAQLAQREFTNALQLFPSLDHGWHPQVLLSSAISLTGMAETWAMISDFEKHLKSNGHWQKQRDDQRDIWLMDYLWHSFRQKLFQTPQAQTHFQQLCRQVRQGDLNPFQAVDVFLSTIPI